MTSQTPDPEGPDSEAADSEWNDSNWLDDEEPVDLDQVRADDLAAGLAALGNLTRDSAIDLYVQTDLNELSFMRVRMTKVLLETMARRHAFCFAEDVIEARQNLEPASSFLPMPDGEAKFLTNWSMTVKNGRFSFHAGYRDSDKGGVRSQEVDFARLARHIADLPETKDMLWPFSFESGNLVMNENGESSTFAELVVRECPDAAARKRAFDLAARIALGSAPAGVDAQTAGRRRRSTGI